MKKLIFGISLALTVMFFSAFTSFKTATFTQTYFYKGTDGLYHPYTGLYTSLKCINDPNSAYCIYKWYNNASISIPVLTQSELDQLVADGSLLPYGSTQKRFIP